MEISASRGIEGSVQESPGIVHRVLKIFTDIRPGEAATVFLLTLNVFLLLLAYYLIKPVREALIIGGKGPYVKISLAAAQAFLFIFVVKAFSRLASKFPRHLLITWVTLFFISNLGLFYFFHLLGMPIGTMGIIFFTWTGIFNLLVIAQFWGFANDIYTEEAGKRLFPMIAIGQTCGGVFGSSIARAIIGPLGSDFAYTMLLITAGLLGIPIALTIIVHKREIRQIRESAFKVDAKLIEEEKVKEQPLKKGGGFRLIFKSKYLLFYALLIFSLNYVNQTGESIWTVTLDKAATKAVQTGTAGGLDKVQFIGKLSSEYQFAAAIIALFLQLFLVSRIFKWIGVGGALLFMPLIALGGYAVASFGVTLLLIKWVKGVENGLDYSLMNTAKGAVFLVTSREEKYKAKAATDTFFYRGGDALAALVFILGSNLLGFSVKSFAGLNVAIILTWIFFGILVIREYKKIKAKTAVAGAQPAG
jgi:AAA family ATP:ADP antiporter